MNLKTKQSFFYSIILYIDLICANTRQNVYIHKIPNKRKRFFCIPEDITLRFHVKDDQGDK